MSKFQTEREFLDKYYPAILTKLGDSFDSGDFITAYKNLYPIEYAEALRKCSSYGAFHTWIARWFLTGLANKNVLEKGEAQSRESINRNKTKNYVWTKIK